MEYTYTDTQIMQEMAKRMTTEALEFIVAMGTDTSYAEFKEEWDRVNPNKSYFISGFK